MPTFQAKAVDVRGASPVKKPFDSRATAATTAYVFLGTTCPASQSYVDRLKELDRRYSPKGVEFVFVYPNRTDSGEAKTVFQKTHGLGGRMIDDQGARIADALGVERTSSVVLVGKDGTVLYRGAIDDSPQEPAKVTERYVAAALDEHLAGKPVTKATTPVFA